MHKVITIERGWRDGQPTFAARCTEPGCDAVTFGGSPSRAAAREALRGHEKAPGAGSTEGQSPAVSAAENEIHTHTLIKELTMNTAIVPDHTDNNNRARAAAWQERQRLTDRITAILEGPGRQEIIAEASAALTGAIAEGDVDPDELGDEIGYTFDALAWYLDESGDNATAEIVEAALRVSGRDPHVACAIVESVPAAGGALPPPNFPAPTDVAPPWWAAEVGAWEPCDTEWIGAYRRPIIEGVELWAAPTSRAPGVVLDAEPSLDFDLTAFYGTVEEIAAFMRDFAEKLVSTADLLERRSA